MNDNRITCFSTKQIHIYMEYVGYYIEKVEAQ